MVVRACLFVKLFLDLFASARIRLYLYVDSHPRPMPPSSSDSRFFETTRGQIVGLLRRSPRTVEEMAQAVGLTDNAVRAHLSTLERDGLIAQEGVRRAEGPGKPATVYTLRPEAEARFSRAYAPVLTALLDELALQLPADARDRVMQAVGRRLASQTPREHAGVLAVRAATGASLLNSLGGDAVVEDHDGRVSIRGCGCPLSATTAHGAAACKVVETLLSEVMGVPVRETCDRGDRPRCCFQVGSAA